MKQPAQLLEETLVVVRRDFQFDTEIAVLREATRRLRVCGDSKMGTSESALFFRAAGAGARRIHALEQGRRVVDRASRRRRLRKAAPR